MTFKPEEWKRLAHFDQPVYVRGDGPSWFVPNSAGDHVLQRLSGGVAAGGDPAVRRFLDRLPEMPDVPYAGRAAALDLTHLRELWFHVTDNCNLACRHCLFSSGPGCRAELSADRILDIAKEAASLGCKVFALTGGEPFVHREFDRIVDGLLAHEEAHVVVLTNGLLLRDRIRRQWFESSRFHLQVSVDGLGKNHDRIRGAGRFTQLSGDLAFLKSEGFPFTLSMCVDRENAADMPEMVDFAVEAGAANLHFMWYFIRGRAGQGEYALPADLFEPLSQAATRAGEAGLPIDNITALKSQIFAPPGTIHDGSTSGWESLAVGPDGKLYPSAALVGVTELATDLAPEGLAAAWREGEILNRIRRSTAAGHPSPLRFILGGGDTDHSWFHGGTFTGDDPYLPLQEKMALWLITREAKGQADQGDPSLLLKMGDRLESCGAHGRVALAHPNCLLAVAGEDSHSAVKAFYADAAVSTREDILNPVCYPEAVLRHIPDQLRFRGYGCGSPVMDADIREGEKVVDLGSGRGVECFIAAHLVGREGRVTGVDMLDPMLKIAREGAALVSRNLGYDNLAFEKGYLEALPLEGESADLVLSNCVMNLSVDKRSAFAEIFRVLKKGGRLVISDVVTETEPGAAIKNDEGLRGECIAGALTQKDLMALLRETGFTALRLLKRFFYREVGGHPFFSLTYEAVKPEKEEQRVRVIYRGPFASVESEEGHLLTCGAVCEIPESEAARMGDRLFVLDSAGAVANMAQGSGCACACTAPPESADISILGASPESTGISILGALPESAGIPTSGASPKPTGLSIPGALPESADISIPVPPKSASAEKFSSGCMVCGAPLTYRSQAIETECAYCDERVAATAVCENGHFVCDGCHVKDAKAVVERILAETSETDMVELLARIRAHPALPLHGPEHHFLVPGIIIATPVAPGQLVQKGDKVIILESMKMENELRSPRDGIVSRVQVKAGDNVEKDQALAVISDPP